MSDCVSVECQAQIHENCTPTKSAIKKSIGEYQFLYKIGEGSNSKVFLVFSAQTKKFYAAKEFNINKRPDFQSFIREYNAFQALQHPNIIGYEGVIEKDNKVYILMEHANHGSLADIPRKNLTKEFVVSVYKQIVSALCYMHSKGYVHQDIKPGNILLFSNGTAKLADLGNCERAIEAGDLFGTPAYQPPEIFADFDGDYEDIPPIDHYKGDVWSLGISIYQTIFGDLPFKGTNIYEITRVALRTKFEVPSTDYAEAAQLLNQMIVADPTHRIEMEEVLKHPFFSL